MIKTIFFFFIFWFALMLSVILLPVYYLCLVFKLDNAKRKFIFFVTNKWAKFTLFTAGIKVTVKGLENIPESKTGFVIVSNHQGNFDIPVIMAALPLAAGFIAKQEIAKFPFISSWMRALDCLFINRNRPRESGKKIFERIRQKDKNPIFLFPEGTRSKGPVMGLFKTGSLKLIYQNNSNILPVTINGSYKCFEYQNAIKSSTVEVYFHPILSPNYKEEDNFDDYNIELQRIISQPITN